MYHVQDIHSLTEFHRNTKRHLKMLRRSGRPEILTINGRAALVVQDAARYQESLDVLERAETIDGIRRGLASMRKGGGAPAEKVFERLVRKYGPRRRPE
jgi:predicted transcriptional regulator